jgi:hypothetical protein
MSYLEGNCSDLIGVMSRHLPAGTVEVIITMYCIGKTVFLKQEFMFREKQPLQLSHIKSQILDFEKELVTVFS